MPLANQSVRQANQLLKRERELKGWSQGDLARQINVPDYYISRWERGNVVPSSYYQQRICKLFGKTAEDLGFLQQPSPPNAQIESPTSTIGSQAPSSSQKWHRAFHHPYISFILLGIIILGALAGIGDFLSTQTSSTAHGLIVGSVSFSDSDIFSKNSSQGMADEVHLTLHLDRPPSANMAYYAWLMPDQNNPEGNVVPLGPLVSRGSQAQLLYQGDPLHTNLLLTHGSLLVTEQARFPIPQAPLINQSHYQSVIDQVRAPGTPYSLLDHFRHLLALDPDLEAHALHGGLITWLVQNSQQVHTWVKDANNQRENQKTLHLDLVRILTYLDGLDEVSHDLPGSPLPSHLVDQNRGSIGLLNLVPGQSVPGYLLHIDNHLRGIMVSPGVSNQQRLLADRLVTAIDRISLFLQQFRAETLHLLRLSSLPTVSQLVELTTIENQSQEDILQFAHSVLQLLNFSITAP